MRDWAGGDRACGFRALDMGCQLPALPDLIFSTTSFFQYILSQIIFTMHLARRASNRAIETCRRGLKR